MKRRVSVLIVMVLAFTIVLMTGCSGLNIMSSNVQLYKEKKSGVETTNVNGVKANEIMVSNNVGNITLSATDSSRITVRMTKKVMGNDRDEVKEVYSRIAPYVEIRNGRLEIKAVERNDREDVWAWLSSNHSGINVNIDFNIELPKSFKSYSINNVTGTINFRDVEGRLDVENKTGNIDLDNTVLAGDNRINLSTGNITMDVDLKNANRLDVTNSTGNIKLVMPSNSKVSFDASVTTGNIGGNFEGMGSKAGAGGLDISREFNGGGKNISIKLITGNLTVDSK